jgi:hypothetical protein
VAPHLVNDKYRFLTPPPSLQFDGGGGSDGWVDLRRSKPLSQPPSALSLVTNAAAATQIVTATATTVDGRAHDEL